MTDKEIKVHLLNKLTAPLLCGRDLCSVMLKNHTVPAIMDFTSQQET